MIVRIGYRKNKVDVLLYIRKLILHLFNQRFVSTSSSRSNFRSLFLIMNCIQFLKYLFTLPRNYQ